MSVKIDENTLIIKKKNLITYSFGVLKCQKIKESTSPNKRKNSPI